ncbi:hypothetical protein G9A89_004142 [Geosiphon pyriformis]|nr:hypothetical protein G9A89_004142 [Geosiphon pyriformis]
MDLDHYVFWYKDVKHWFLASFLDAVRAKKGKVLQKSSERFKKWIVAFLDAVRLTQCEIATANLDVPMECQAEKDVGKCVEALARIPQLWTSYSGYFRQVYLLEELHKNITINQVANFEILRIQQREMIAWRKQEMTKLENLEDLQKGILESVGQIEKTTGIVNNVMTKLKSNLEDAREIVNSVLSKQYETAGKLDDVANFTNGVFSSIQTNVSGIFEVNIVFNSLYSSGFFVTDSQEHVKIPQIIEIIKGSLKHMATSSLTVQHVQKTTEQGLIEIKEMTQESANYATKNLENLSNMLQTMTETTKIILENHLGKLEDSLQSLEILNSIVNDITNLQEELRNDITENKKAQKELTAEWLASFEETRKNLHDLLYLSRSEIRLLTDTTIEARESHQDMIKLVRPLVTIVDIANWGYGQLINFGVLNTTIMVIIAVLSLRKIIHWIKPDSFMVSIVDFSNLLTLLLFCRHFGWQNSILICSAVTATILAFLLVRSLLKFRKGPLNINSESVDSWIYKDLRPSQFQQTHRHVFSSKARRPNLPVPTRRQLGDAYFARAIIQLPNSEKGLIKKSRKFC